MEISSRQQREQSKPFVVIIQCSTRKLKEKQDLDASSLRGSKLLPVTHLNL